MDVAVSSENGEPAAAVMNYGPKPADVAISPLNLEPGRTYVVLDLNTGTRTARLGKEISPWRAKVPAHGFIAVRIIPE